MHSVKNRGDEAIFTKPLMNANEIATYLINSCNALKYFDSYMFGSTLKVGATEDIDLLIVGPSGEALSALKRELFYAGSQLPLDVIYMLPSEAIETDFVNKAGCVKLSFLAGTEHINTDAT